MRVSLLSEPALVDFRHPCGRGRFTLFMSLLTEVMNLMLLGLSLIELLIFFSVVCLVVSLVAVVSSSVFVIVIVLLHSYRTWLL